MLQGNPKYNVNLVMYEPYFSIFGTKNLILICCRYDQLCHEARGYLDITQALEKIVSTLIANIAMFFN